MVVDQSNQNLSLEVVVESRLFFSQARWKIDNSISLHLQIYSTKEQGTTSSMQDLVDMLSTVHLLIMHKLIMHISYTA